MKKPKITIITAVYNIIKSEREESFRTCVEIVHNQTYKNIEHILIYTPCEDGTKELVDEYVNKGWCKCEIQPKRGIWEAMQKGLDSATGDYINFMNSDDKFSFPYSVEMIANAIVENQAAFAYSDTRGILPDKNELYWKGNIKTVPFGSCMCHQSLFASTKLLREVGGFNLNYEIALDDFLTLELLLTGQKYAYVPKPLVTYYYGGWSYQTKPEEFRESYAINFYERLGKNMGLTMDECRDLWHLEAVNNRSKDYCKNLAKKIKVPEWRNTLLEKLKQKEGKYFKQTFSFIGIPFLQTFENENAAFLKLAGIQVLSVERDPHEKIAKIFGLLKFKKEEKEKKVTCYMLGVPVFFKKYEGKIKCK